MKKVFIGVLAALMLFAFVGCDNSTPVVETPKTLSEIGYRVVGDTNYISGEAFDASAFEFIAIYGDGSSEVIPATDLMTATEILTNATNAAAKKFVELSYLNGSKSVKVPVTVYPINDVAVSGTPATQYAAKGGVAGSATDTTNFDKTGLTVTGQYKENNEVVYSIALDADDYTVTYDSQATSVGKSQDATVTVKSTVAVAEPTAEVAIKTVLDAVDPDSLKIEAKKDFTPINYQEYKSGDYVVVGKTLSGADLDEAGIENFGTLGSMKFTDTNTTNTRYTANSRLAVTFLPTGGNEYEDLVELEVGVSPVADTPKTATAGWKDGTAPSNLKKGDPISTDLISMTYTWNSGYTEYGQEGKPSAPSVSISIVPTTVREDAGETQNVYVKVTNFDVDVEYSPSGSCLTFNVDDAE